MAGPDPTPFEAVMRRLNDIASTLENSPTANNDWALRAVANDLIDTIGLLAQALKPFLTSP